MKGCLAWLRSRPSRKRSLGYFLLAAASLEMEDTMTRTVSATHEVADLDDSLDKMRRGLADIIKSYQILRSDCTSLEFEVRAQSKTVTDEVTTTISNYERDLAQQTKAVDEELGRIRKEVQWLKSEKTDLQGQVMLLESEIRSCEEQVGIEALT